MDINEITEKVLFCAYRVHSELGPGLLEKAYEDCLLYELTLQGLQVEAQKLLPLKYRDILIETGYRLDLLVEGKVIVEIKATDAFKDVHLAQVLTYLRLTECKIGLLLNFNVKSLKHGIKRVAL
ncbi:GxxExxY protein [Litoribacter alkaliphilus]|uniref:GxxExxY protein n=1 Tax=Litoribacter ruber TaxID=702568 RepID=A0AAP2CGB3_9BACT|nr:GxxExxY protein [Litoribacter alkaliphilus]MBS9524103.1 GxxExxY protein [Litoribacter alkaliphilus]